MRAFNRSNGSLQEAYRPPQISYLLLRGPQSRKDKCNKGKWKQRKKSERKKKAEKETGNWFWCSVGAAETGPPAHWLSGQHCPENTL